MLPNTGESNAKRSSRVLVVSKPFWVTALNTVSRPIPDLSMASLNTALLIPICKLPVNTSPESPEHLLLPISANISPNVFPFDSGEKIMLHPLDPSGPTGPSLIKSIN